MGNCLETLRTSRYEYTLLKDIDSPLIGGDEKYCTLTELPVTQCNCEKCLEEAPPHSLSGKLVKFYTENQKFYCVYVGVDMDPQDLTGEKDIVCRRGDSMRTVLFNGEQVSYV